MHLQLYGLIGTLWNGDDLCTLAFGLSILAYVVSPSVKPVASG